MENSPIIFSRKAVMLSLLRKQDDISRGENVTVLQGNSLVFLRLKWTLLVYHVCEKVLAVVRVCVTGQGPDGVACRRRHRDIYLELQSGRLRGGVRYCRPGLTGSEASSRGRGGVGGLWGQRLTSGVTGRYPHRVGVASAPEKRRRRLGEGPSIGRFWWGADAQYADVWSNCATLNWFPLLISMRTIPGSGAGVSRGQPPSLGQNEQPLAGGALDVWTWIRLYLVTTILIDSNVCLSGTASDICHSAEEVWNGNQTIHWVLLSWVIVLHFWKMIERKKTSTMSLNSRNGARFQIVVWVSGITIIPTLIL